MKKVTFYLLALFCVLNTWAQERQNLQVISNGEELYRQAFRHQNLGNYDEALKTYKTIPYGDPFYENARFKIAYCYEQKSMYETAIEILNDLASDPSSRINNALLYTELGNCYDEIGQVDKALELYDLCIAEYPYNYQAYFNKGVTLLRQKSIEEALTCFKKSIFLNPTYQASHFQYANCCFQLGYSIPGLLALNYVTLLDPFSRYTLIALQTLDEIYDSGIAAFNSDNDIIVHADYIEKNQFYQEAVIAINKALMSPNSVKVPTKVNHAITRCNYVLFSTAKVRPNSYELEDQIYLPAFQKILQEKKYNTLCYFQFSNTDLDNDKVATKAAKMQSEFYNFLYLILNDLQACTLYGVGKAPSDTSYYYKSSELSYWRFPTAGGGATDSTVCYLNDYGQIQTIEHRKEGVKHDSLKFFVDNKLSEEYILQNGKYDGPVYTYNYAPYGDQRVPIHLFTIKNEKVNGTYKEYNEAGMKTHTLTIDSDFRKQGLYQQYYPDGLSITHLADGSVLDTLLFINNQLHGPGRDFYPTGERMSEANFCLGLHDGKTRHYYPHGTIQSEYNMELNMLQGNRTDYYATGNLRIKSTYMQDEHEGIQYIYAPDGQTVLVQLLYSHDFLFKYAYLQKDGTMSEWEDVPTNAHTINAYYPSGKLAASIELDKAYLNGANVTYYPDGQAAYTTEYYFNKNVGPIMQYQNNGQLLYLNTKESEDQVIEMYHDNGQKLYEGHYFYGIPNGDFIVYDRDGNINRKIQMYYGIPKPIQ